MPGFYGRRKGRKLSDGANELLQELPLDMQILPCEEGQGLILPAFTQSQPIYLEIGFGMGDHLYQLAVNNPNVNLIGCEPFINGVYGLLRQYYQAKLDVNNLKLYTHDARILLQAMECDYLEKIFILFPDPWQKKKHNKRRIINKDTIADCARILKSGGLLRMATDDVNYVEWILQLFNQQADVFEAQGFKIEQCLAAGNYEAIQVPPSDWHNTKYERKALEQGRKCHYMDFIKI